MDLNPLPMKNFKPVEIVDNAADQFWKTHQGPHEARAVPSRDGVDAVERHNRACPRLEDELQKRRSVSKVTTNKCNALKAGACKMSNHRTQAHSTASPRRTEKTIKTTKFEKGTPRKVFNRRRKLKSIVGTCPRCLCLLKKEKQMPFRLKRSIENIFTATEFDKSQSEDDAASLRMKTAKKEKRRREERISIASSNYPDTSNQSFASYHSFASMDKEPMI